VIEIYLALEFEFKRVELNEFCKSVFKILHWFSHFGVLTVLKMMLTTPGGARNFLGIMK
jgi:hypothetical protein